MKNFKTTVQMRKGVLEFCIMAIIDSRDRYTLEVIDVLKQANMLVVEGTVYPLLIRLKNEGYLSYRWQESKQGPPRKYYTMTEKGKFFLEELKKNWSMMVASVHSITNQLKQ